MAIQAAPQILEPDEAARDPRSGRAPIIVIGGGPAGLRAAQEVARRGLEAVLFNAERWRPYNRVKLTPFFAGDVQIGQIYQPPLFAGAGRVRQYSDHRITAIDRAAKTVTGQFGRCWPYDKLIIATGARPHIPKLPGIDLPGVYTFRNLDDVERLMARTARARRAAVIGGGLLGLEAARGMARHCETVVVEHESHPMARQLDLEAGALLKRQIEALGIGLRVSVSVRQILGERSVEGLSLSDGETLACDTVIICTGIRPNVDLAREAGLDIGRGITVNARMQTSDPDIYAIGECAEHKGEIYGLVGPGLEQAGVATAHIAGESASYSGSTPTTKLKVAGIDVFSMGDVEQADQRGDVRFALWRSEDGTRYRRLILDKGRLAGALGVGDWPEVSWLQQAVAARALVWPWQIWQFRKTGRLTDIDLEASVVTWPAGATVCNCTGVTRGQLGEAIARGCASVEELSRETSACTVCQSCKPHLMTLLGGGARAEPVPYWRSIAAVSVLAALIAAIVFLLPGWPVTTSVQAKPRIDLLWIDGTTKQITGFTLLALSLVAGALSLRKRIKRIPLSYASWRLIHTVLGLVTLAVLFVHTGFHLGKNLNLALMMCFLGLMAIGAFAGAVTALEHRLAPAGAKTPRRVPVWLHILALWPLPLLLGLHILTVYFY